MKTLSDPINKLPAIVLDRLGCLAFWTGLDDKLMRRSILKM